MQGCWNIGTISLGPATEQLLAALQSPMVTDDTKGRKICLLLEGRKAGLSDLEKQKLLDMASKNGHTGCVEVLLAAGCRPEVCTREDGWGPLHLAAFHGHTDWDRHVSTWPCWSTSPIC